MKILLTTGVFEPEAGGPATLTPKLASAFAAAGHQVKVITYSDERHYLTDKKYDFSLVRIARSNKVSNYARFFWRVFRELPKYDFIYSLDWFTAGIPVSLACRLRRKRYVLRIGGGYIWERHLARGGERMSLVHFYERGVYKRYPVFYWLMRWVLRGAEHIIFNTTVQPSFYIPHFGLDPEKVSTIFNPIPRSAVNVERGEANKEILFAGRLNAKNNVSSAIKAFAKADLPGFSFTVIGDGPEKENLVALANSLMLGDRVSFAGTLPQQELFDRVKDCYFIILPSWTDISPNTAYEALAIGVPFLVTQETYLSIRDQIPLTFDPASVDDIAEKMEHLASAENYAEYSRQLSKIELDYFLEDFFEDHLSLFDKVGSSMLNDKEKE